LDSGISTQPLWSFLRQPVAGQYKEGAGGMGLAQPGQAMEVFASSHGSWTMVLTMPDGKACMIATGDNWEMVTRIKGDPI